MYGSRTLGRAHCICTCTVFDMDSLSDAPVVRRPACLGMLIVRVHVQCMTWPAWAAYVVYMSACACTYVLYLCLYVRTVLVLVQCLAWTARARHVIYVSAYACTVFGMGNRNGAPG